ncbi:transcription repressor NadR [Enterococcus sp. BWB1-3]|uniref:transcription repressor NadR n=1 Tax=unclassified Enterococcus TaxID=2608891 RepID=UPI001923BFC4|nr:MULTISPECIES: transcription repressor NadR [unclassified Enterococcus]MBL1230684.1 transcription repressor NadR [Enterococcus sp. BWB1-3]MCB5952909.1 transcription repressor NadR [Enterococcus sp. BWT-B8]MCB5953583.1 transcription repressor NadR [Enterococcus sp. CWB-B31]
MEGTKRRTEILEVLKEAEKPVSASKLAGKFVVSRQIIVGDVALLRASGHEIIATARGYMLEKEERGFSAKIVCQHRPDQTEEELSCIVELGGEILDVIVEHPIYGELTGNLRISSESEVQRFINTLKHSRAALLSELTGGLHLHTIRCRDQQHLEIIKQALLEKKILYQN